MKGETMLKKIQPINPILSEINLADFIKNTFLKTILILYSNPRLSFKVYFEFATHKDKSLCFTPCFLKHNDGLCRGARWRSG